MAPVENLVHHGSIKDLDGLSRNKAVVTEIPVLTLATPVGNDVGGQTEPGPTTACLGWGYCGPFVEFPGAHLDRQNLVADPGGIRAAGNGTLGKLRIGAHHDQGVLGT